MTYKEVVDKFLDKVNVIFRLKPAYKQPGDGSDGTCDCVGLIIGAIRRMGLKWTGIHGSNWAARRELVELKKIGSVNDLEVGEAILKAREKGEAKWQLPARYRNGGKYYNGDLRDYYHIGVVTSVKPLKITHMTSPTVKVDTSLGKWGYHGRLTILAKAANEPAPAPAPVPDTPTSGSRAIVVSGNGLPVKLRQYPSTSCRTWDKIPVGTEVEIIDPGEDWAKINCGNRKGWYMMAAFLDIVGDGKGRY